MLIKKQFTNCIKLLTSNFLIKFQSSKLPPKKYRDKFKLDYEYFSNIPINQRQDQLEKINATKKLNVEFKKQIPQFPINQYWDYHGTKLMTHTWTPLNHAKPKAVLVFFHSLNGHTGTIGQLASVLAGDGYITTGYDYVNFGQSEGNRRGCIQSFDQLVNLSEQYLIKVKTQYPNVNVYVTGLSLGGAIAFKILLKTPNIASGAIFLSPSIRQNTMHFPIMKKLTVLFSLFFPYYKLLKQTGRNGSKYRLDTYSKNDPFLYHGRLYPKSVRQILLAMSNIKRQYKKFSSPYLLIQSGCDKLVDPFASIDLQNQAASKDKTTVIIHDMWHAVWLDDRMPDVIKIVQQWLNQRS